MDEAINAKNSHSKKKDTVGEGEEVMEKKSKSKKRLK